MCEIVYCKKCGAMRFKALVEMHQLKKFHNTTHCPQCNIPYENANIEDSMDSIEKMNAFREKHIFNQPEFDEEQYSIREDKEEKRIEHIVRKNPLNLSTPLEIRCPKCNSNQIQAINKKWSFLTGFLTNKVDRICLNCKNKF